MLRLRHFLYVLALITLAFSRARAADIYDCYNGSSEQGGNRVTVNGIQTNQYVQQSFPGATVTVYAHNTLTLASIFQDAAGTLPLANPFSSSAHSVAFVCAADGRYDFKYSGTGIVTPFTVSDIKYCFACQGGGGGVTPGTPKQVTRYNSAGTNVEDSSGSDDPANGPTRWTNGLSVTTNGLAKQAVNSPNGTTVNLLACADPSVTLTFQVTTCSAGTTKALGVVDNGAGTSGNVQIYDHAYHPCVMDNQTAINDYVAPSATSAGQCSDVGGAKPNNVEILGKVVSINSGAGTLATVDWFTGDTIAPGSGGGSGTVSTCATANSNALFVLAGTVVSCDGFVTDDSAGNMTMFSLGLTNPNFAGFLWQVQGPAPTLAVSNAIYHYAPSSVPTSWTYVDPSAPATGCLYGTNVANVVTLSFLGGCGGSANIKVNTSAITGTNANFSDSTPATTANHVNVTWQKDSSTPDTNISAQVAAATDTTLGVLKSITCAAGQFITSYASGTGVPTCAVPASGSGTNKIPFDSCTADGTLNPGNAYWRAVTYTASAGVTSADIGTWEYAINAAGTVICKLEIPSNASGTLHVFLDVSALDSVAGHTAAFKVCYGVSSSQNINNLSYTCTATQNYTSTATAYANTRLDFTTTAGTIGEYLVANIVQNAGGTNTNPVRMVAKVKVF